MCHLYPKISEMETHLFSHGPPAKLGDVRKVLHVVRQETEFNLNDNYVWHLQLTKMTLSKQRRIDVYKGKVKYKQVATCSQCCSARPLSTQLAIIKKWEENI